MSVTAEIEAVEQLHQAAQARLGIAAAYLALSEWKSVNALEADQSAQGWILTSIRIIIAVRKISRQLAISYYQLVRGLETGSTLGAPANSTGNVTLGDLRKNFRDIALDVAALPSPLSPSDDPDIRWFEEQLSSVDLPDEAPTPGRLIRLDDAEVDPLVQDLLDVEDSSTNSDPVTTDEFDWEEAMTRDEIDEAYRDLLRQQAQDAAKKARNLRTSTELTPDQVITQIEKSHAAAGSIGAGTVDAAGMEGGRQVIDTALRSDRKVKMIARGTSSNPCAFCAMLASRGFVFVGATSGVGNREDFTVGDDIKRYHTNCHCFPIVKFTTESKLPELNRYFKEQWPIVTEGYSGLDALNAWRRWIYAKRKITPDAPFGAFNNKTP
jgi:hypothetical protein